jgi:hypothetical protein
VTAIRRLIEEFEDLVPVGTHGTFLSRLLLAHRHPMDWETSHAMRRNFGARKLAGRASLVVLSVS